MIPTRLGRLSRPLAWTLCCATAVLVLAGLTALTPAAQTTDEVPPESRAADWELYRSVRARLQQGEGYYDAFGDELRTRNYPAGSIFAWRTPLHLWLLGSLPHLVIGKVILGAVGLLALFLTWRLIAPRAGPVPASAAVLLLLGALLPCLIADAQLFAEVWSSAFLVCSALLTAHGHRRSAVAFGLAAVLLRELALPYLVIALAVAWWQRRRAEALAWAAALAVFAVYLGAHAWVVSGLLTAADLAVVGGWIRFGGLQFVLSSARMHALLLVLPAWVTAFYVPLALLGLLAWPDRRALPLRLTGIAFVAAFLIVGRPENFYWGALYTPFLALGIVWAPMGIRDLVRSLRQPPSTQQDFRS